MGYIPAPGSPGESAYQIAVDNGFVGTEAEWLASLVGPPGPPGPPSEPFVWVQSTPAATWTMPHGLGRVPASVQVVIGTEVVDTDTDVDATNAVLTFPSPIAGTAYIL